ncbi:MAG: hypothetical protein R3A45_08895 [Bdellovibrionota bacterium]
MKTAFTNTMNPFVFMVSSVSIFTITLLGVCFPDFSDHFLFPTIQSELIKDFSWFYVLADGQKIRFLLLQL